MNNKVDDVLYKLVETKKFIAKAALNDNSNTSYENTIKGLHNIIVDYTMNNKMSRKEILDITFSLYDIEVEKTFLSILHILCWGILGGYCSSIGIHGTRSYIIILIVGIIDILSAVASNL